MENLETGGRQELALPTYALVVRLRMTPHLVLIFLLKEVEKEMKVRM